MKQVGFHKLLSFMHNLFSASAKFSEKTNISNPLIRTRTCTYQGIKNVSFSEDFANVLNGSFLMLHKKSLKNTTIDLFKMFDETNLNALIMEQFMF